MSFIHSHCPPPVNGSSIAPPIRHCRANDWFVEYGNKCRFALNMEGVNRCVAVSSDILRHCIKENPRDCIVYAHWSKNPTNFWTNDFLSIGSKWKILIDPDLILDTH